MSQTLVILSLPFQRLIRSHLSPMVMDVLMSKADVIIITPFANQPLFRKRYERPGVLILAPPIPENLSWLSQKLLAISSILRMHGYWFRLGRDMRYLWSNRHVKFGENGDDHQKGLGSRLVRDALGIMGFSSIVWQVFDSLHGDRTYAFPELQYLTSKYREVVFIQSSSWGFQDALLGYLARSQSWRSIFLPYTTDQLLCNGWLYCNFDTVCAQGNAEERYARTYHKISNQKVVKLGSLNFFSMRQVINKKLMPMEISKPREVQRLLFAGSIPTYFPTDSEFQCLEFILSQIEAGNLENVSITYRPIGNSPEIRSLIQQKFNGRKHINIEYASPTIYGLDTYSDCEWEDIIFEHSDKIKGFDLMVMAGMTSLSLDIAVLGTASVSYLGDPSGVLARRKTEFLLNEHGNLIGFEYIPVVRNHVELLEVIKKLLNDPKSREAIVERIISEWDNNTQGIMERLTDVLFRV